MTEPEPDGPPARRRTVDYQSPATAARGRRAEVRDFIIAALLSAVATMATGFLFALANLRLSGTPAPPPKYAVPLIFTGAVAAGLGGIGYHRWTRRGSRAWAAGLLLGLAVGGLIEGICFFAL